MNLSYNGAWRHLQHIRTLIVQHGRRVPSADGFVQWSSVSSMVTTTDRPTANDVSTGDHRPRKRYLLPSRNIKSVFLTGAVAQWLRQRTSNPDVPEWDNQTSTAPAPEAFQSRLTILHFLWTSRDRIVEKVLGCSEKTQSVLSALTGQVNSMSSMACMAPTCNVDYARTCLSYARHSLAINWGNGTAAAASRQRVCSATEVSIIALFRRMTACDSVYKSTQVTLLDNAFSRLCGTNLKTSHLICPTACNASACLPVTCGDISECLAQNTAGCDTQEVLENALYHQGAREKQCQLKNDTGIQLAHRPGLNAVLRCMKGFTTTWMDTESMPMGLYCNGLKGLSQCLEPLEKQEDASKDPLLFKPAKYSRQLVNMIRDRLCDFLPEKGLFQLNGGDDKRIGLVKEDFLLPAAERCLLYSSVEVCVKLNTVRCPRAVAWPLTQHLGRWKQVAESTCCQGHCDPTQAVLCYLDVHHKAKSPVPDWKGICSKVFEARKCIAELTVECDKATQLSISVELEAIVATYGAQSCDKDKILPVCYQTLVDRVKTILDFDPLDRSHPAYKYKPENQQGAGSTKGPDSKGGAQGNSKKPDSAPGGPKVNDKKPGDNKSKGGKSDNKGPGGKSDNKGGTSDKGGKSVNKGGKSQNSKDASGGSKKSPQESGHKVDFPDTYLGKVCKEAQTAFLCTHESLQKAPPSAVHGLSDVLTTTWKLAWLKCQGACDVQKVTGCLSQMSAAMLKTDKVNCSLSEREECMKNHTKGCQPMQRIFPYQALCTKARRLCPAKPVEVPELPEDLRPFNKCLHAFSSSFDAGKVDPSVLLAPVEQLVTCLITTWEVDSIVAQPPVYKVYITQVFFFLQRVLLPAVTLTSQCATGLKMASFSFYEQVILMLLRPFASFSTSADFCLSVKEVALCYKEAVGKCTSNADSLRVRFQSAFPVQYQFGVKVCGLNVSTWSVEGGQCGAPVCDQGAAAACLTISDLTSAAKAYAEAPKKLREAQALNLSTCSAGRQRQMDLVVTFFKDVSGQVCGKPHYCNVRRVHKCVLAVVNTIGGLGVKSSADDVCRARQCLQEKTGECTESGRGFYQKLLAAKLKMYATLTSHCSDVYTCLRTMITVSRQILSKEDAPEPKPDSKQGGSDGNSKGNKSGNNSKGGGQSGGKKNSAPSKGADNPGSPSTGQETRDSNSSLSFLCLRAHHSWKCASSSLQLLPSTQQKLLLPIFQSLWTVVSQRCRDSMPLTCYKCSNVSVTDFGSGTSDPCKAETELCGHNERCSSQYSSVQGNKYVTRGCMKFAHCHAKDKHNVDVKCCDKDRCNTNDHVPSPGTGETTSKCYLEHAVGCAITFAELLLSRGSVDCKKLERAVKCQFVRTRSCRSILSTVATVHFQTTLKAAITACKPSVLVALPDPADVYTSHAQCFRKLFEQVHTAMNSTSFVKPFCLASAAFRACQSAQSSQKLSSFLANNTLEMLNQVATPENCANVSKNDSATRTKRDSTCSTEDRTNATFFVLLASMFNFYPLSSRAKLCVNIKSKLACAKTHAEGCLSSEIKAVQDAANATKGLRTEVSYCVKRNKTAGLSVSLLNYTTACTAGKPCSLKDALACLELKEGESPADCHKKQKTEISVASFTAKCYTSSKIGISASLTRVTRLVEGVCKDVVLPPPPICPSLPSDQRRCNIGAAFTCVISFNKHLLSQGIPGPFWRDVCSYVRKAYACVNASTLTCTAAQRNVAIAHITRQFQRLSVRELRCFGTELEPCLLKGKAASWEALNKPANANDSAACKQMTEARLCLNTRLNNMLGGDRTVQRQTVHSIALKLITTVDRWCSSPGIFHQCKSDKQADCQKATQAAQKCLTSVNASSVQCR
ncbi:hypothetical protein ACOMHN_048879 [Nucella lapillus]